MRIFSHGTPAEDRCPWGFHGNRLRSVMKEINKPTICVVHLVWTPIGTEPLKRFLESYSGYCAGMEHDLIVIFNGFNSDRELNGYREMLASVPYIPFYLPKPSLDIVSYFRAVRSFKYDYYCFVNSYTRILDNDWLLKLYRHINNANVGLVGATGSYESMYTVFLEGKEAIKDENIFIRIRKSWRQKIKMLKKRSRFLPYPNYHLRTNGFMASRQVLEKVRTGIIFRKTHAYKFESGKNSMTRQVLNMGLKVIVVGKNGHGYEMSQWHMSGTFRQGNQENLLIADNQTDMYAKADAATRLMLVRRSWGDHAGAFHAWRSTE